MQAVFDENPIFILKRHHIGNQAERGQTDRVEQHFAEPVRNFGSPAGPLTDQPRDFECHAGTR